MCISMFWKWQWAHIAWKQPHRKLPQTPLQWGENGNVIKSYNSLLHIPKRSFTTFIMKKQTLKIEESWNHKIIRYYKASKLWNAYLYLKSRSIYSLLLLFVLIVLSLSPPPSFPSLPPLSGLQSLKLGWFLKAAWALLSWAGQNKKTIFCPHREYIRA